MPGPMIDPVLLIVVVSALVHAVGLAWVARHEAAKVLTAWRRRTADASDLDRAMRTVFLVGDWRWLTSKMTSEEREAAVAAVMRAQAVAYRESPDLSPPSRERLAWWDL